MFHLLTKEGEIYLTKSRSQSQSLFCGEAPHHAIPFILLGSSQLASWYRTISNIKNDITNQKELNMMFHFRMMKLTSRASWLKS